MGLRNYVARDFLGLQPKTTPWVWDEVPHWCVRHVDSYSSERLKAKTSAVLLIEIYSPLSGIYYEVKYAHWTGPLASDKTLEGLCGRLNKEPLTWKQEHRYDEIINWLRSLWHS